MVVRYRHGTRPDRGVIIWNRHKPTKNEHQDERATQDYLTRQTRCVLTAMLMCSNTKEKRSRTLASFTNRESRMLLDQSMLRKQDSGRVRSTQRFLGLCLPIDQHHTQLLVLFLGASCWISAALQISNVAPTHRQIPHTQTPHAVVGCELRHS